VFVHNEALDFGVAVKALSTDQFVETLKRVVEREVAVSRLLEEIAFKRPNVVAFSTALAVERPTRPLTA
jgi:hypothetical protein